MNQRRGGLGIGLIGAIIMAAIALFRYFGSSQVNAVTGEKQHVSVSPQQEVAIGLQAAPHLEQQFGGESDDLAGQQLVDRVGHQIVANSAASKGPYRFDFHLLADRKTINAFALPGGQVFITEALLHKLRSEGQLAGVLGHEVGHVVGRHGAEQLAKQELTQGLTGAAVLATYDPNNPDSRGSAAVAAAIGQLVNMKFGRDDELESDKLGVRFMAESGYDPRAMIAVMQVLKEAGGRGGQPEFFSTHPNPENRISRIKQAVEQTFPNGVPEGLKR
jgi:beta-barrel assembly-enhancing protease